MATTMHWLPNLSAASATKSGLFTAAVLIDTLSAPASSSLRMSATCAHAAADGQRHEALLGGARHDIEDGLAIVGRRGDVEEAELVGAGRIIGLGRLDRIAGVDQIDEVDALDDAAVLDVEAGDDAGLRGSSSNGSLVRRLEDRQRFGRIDAAVIERAAGDRAFELVAHRAWSCARCRRSRPGRRRRSPGSTPPRRARWSRPS